MGPLDDSGVRTEFDTGATRELAPGKGRFDLLPPHALERLAKHFENGAKKYPERNWEKGLPLWSFLDSGLRHFVQLLEGKDNEDHAAAVMWNIACYIETYHRIQTGELPTTLSADLPPKLQKELESSVMMQHNISAPDSISSMRLKDAYGQLSELHDKIMNPAAKTIIGHILTDIKAVIDGH